MPELTNFLYINTLIVQSWTLVSDLRETRSILLDITIYSKLRYGIDLLLLSSLSKMLAWWVEFSSINVECESWKISSGSALEFAASKLSPIPPANRSRWSLPKKVEMSPALKMHPYLSHQNLKEQLLALGSWSNSERRMNFRIFSEKWDSQMCCYRNYESYQENLSGYDL